MKKAFLFLVLAFFIFNESSKAQNVGVAGLSSPVSQCNPTDSQAVNVQIFNYTATIISPANFPVECMIYENGVLFDSVKDVLVTPALLGFGTYNFTFNDSVWLPAQGSYTFKCYTKHPSDVNVANDTLIPYPVI